MHKPRAPDDRTLLDLFIGAADGKRRLPRAYFPRRGLTISMTFDEGTVALNVLNDKNISIASASRYGLIPEPYAPRKAVLFIERLLAKPLTVLAREGRATRICCLCGKPLDDGNSLASGWGRTCARRWRLRWGPHEFRTKLVRNPSRKERT